MSIWGKLFGSDHASASSQPGTEKTITFVFQDVTDPEKQFGMGITLWTGKDVP
jgi:hypothetical protein